MRFQGAIRGLGVGALLLYAAFRFRYALFQAAAGLPLEGPAHPVAEAAVTFAVAAGWSLIAVVISRTRTARQFPAAPVLALFVSAGIATFVALLLASADVSFDGAYPLIFVITAVVMIFIVKRSPVSVEVIDAAPAPSTDNVHRFLALATLAVIGIVTAIVIRDVAYLALHRPPADGDELSFWWTATELLHRLGYEGYMAGFPMAGYLPGYPMVANALVGFVSAPMFEAAGRALPYLFGMAAVSLLLRIPRGHALAPTTAVYFLLAFTLFFDHEWVHAMFFRLWYGEALPVVVFAVLLIVLDSVRQGSAWPPSALAGASLGIGVLAALTKQPLSSLLVPAVLPTIAVVGAAAYWKRRWDRRFLLTAALVAVGALLASQMWAGQIDRYGREVIYDASLSSLLPFYPQGAISRLVPYFFENYKNVWVIFTLTTILALVIDWRRFLPFWLAAAGMIASIFVLYLGPWSTVEHESGARYILHGAYGWILFSLVALRPQISEIVETNIVRLSAIATRLRLRAGSSRLRAPENAGGSS